MGNVEHTPRASVWTRNVFVIFVSLLLFINTLSLLPWGVFHVRSFFHTDDHSTTHISIPSFASISTLNVGEGGGGEEELAALLKAAADILGAVSAQHQLQSLQGISNDLNKLAADTEKSKSSVGLRARNFFDGLAALAGGGAGGATAAKGAAGGASASPLSGLLGGAAGGGLTSLFSSAAGGLLNITADSLAGPAQYLGDGVGRGVTTGLKVSNNVQQTSATKPEGINKLAGNLGFGVSNALAGSFNTSILTAGAGGAASALGAGLGGGTATGLGINKSVIAAPSGTGIPLIAGNLGSGLTQALFSNVDMSKIMGAVSPGQLSSAVVNAGKGLGEGAAQGLALPMSPAAAARKLKLRAMTNTTGGLNADAISFGFTKALSSSFLGSVDVQALANKAMSGSSNLTSMVGPSLVSAGSGFGSGAAQSLGLQNAAVAPVTDANAPAPEIAQNFAYQLTTSFLANGTLPALQKKLMSSTMMVNISAMLGPAAQGAGSGIGQGAAVGLGLQDPSSAQTPMGGSVAMVARDFSYGLTSSFLANGTVANLQSKATALLGSNSTMGNMLDLKSISVSKAAEGLARGLVDGAGQSISNMGGFQRILNGEDKNAIMAEAATPIFSSNGFDDTTGGVATSFGQGLGGEGINLVLQMFGKGTSSGSSSNTSSSSSSSTMTMPLDSPAQSPPSNNLSTPAIRARSHHALPILRRVPSVINTTLKDLNTTIDLSGILTGVNVTSVDVLLQKGVDALTCKGVGGFSQIFAGLKANGSIKAANSSAPSKFQLPNATFTVTSEGNTFEINPAQGSIIVNGISQGRLTILIAAHALLVIVAFLIAIPIALLLSNGHEIAVMLGRPDVLAKADKYRFYIWCFVVVPFGLAGIGLGIFLLGSSTHLSSPHSILGAASLVFVLVGFLLEMQFLPSIRALTLPRATNLTILLILANVLFVTGLVDIQRVSLCTVQLPDAVLVGAGMNIASVFTTGVTVVQAKWVVRRWVKGREAEGLGGVEKGGVEKSSIRLVRGVDEKF
ncbi:cytochrome b b6 petb protein [Rutstroemia sp. NJR-2017a WRK4]|nr:cytochrome b b6 petb protein [Rutstroemia sp. NJR-2017a WRK4]